TKICPDPGIGARLDGRAEPDGAGQRQRQHRRLAYRRTGPDEHARAVSWGCGGAHHPQVRDGRRGWRLRENAGPDQGGHRRYASMTAGYLARRCGTFLVVVWLALTVNFILPRVATPEISRPRGAVGTALDDCAAWHHIT